MPKPAHLSEVAASVSRMDAAQVQQKLELSPDEDGTPLHPEDGTKLREERAIFRHDPLPSLRFPLPRHGGNPNDLSIATRFKWIGALAVGIVLAVGALVSIAGGLLEIFSSLVGTL